MSDDTLAGKTIVITGASSGFGRGAAIELVGLGANVVLAARRDAELQSLAAELGDRALPVAADVSEPADVARIADAAAERFGHIDVWVNNAGIGALGYFWDIPIEDHARVVDVNLKGLIYGAHQALRRFRAQRHGVLVNVGSVDSEVPLALQASYASTKAAVLSLTRSLREELRMVGDDDIEIGAILPWAIDTPWWTHAANHTGHAPRMAAMDDPQLVVDVIVKACAKPKEEMPVGAKGRAAKFSHDFFPDLTERMSGDLMKREVEKATPMGPTSGAIHEPMAGTATIEGGIRARMEAEDTQR